MPTYMQRCTKCKHEFEDFRFISKYNNNPNCPVCGKATKRAVSSAHTETGYSKEMESEALGVNPDQIPEIQRRFPHHRFNPQTGAMLIGSHQEFKRVLKDIGFKDWNSFY